MVRVLLGVQGVGICGLFLIHMNNINVNHRGRARVSVKTRCLVFVNTYGNSRRKLFIKIIVNREMKISEFPLLFSVPVIVFISLCSLSISSFSVLVLWCFVRELIKFLSGLTITPWPFLFN